MTNQPIQIPGLFGLGNSNRDFTKRRNWGKNIFNNAFPAALACYMHHQNIQPIYLTLSHQKELAQATIGVTDLFGISPLEPDVYFAFESDFVPYQPLVINNLPRADLVILNESSGTCISTLEIKLTALPDNSTSHLSDDQYGCELVIRPDTIVYLALSIAWSFKNNRSELRNVFEQLPSISDWADIAAISPVVYVMADILDEFMLSYLHLQRPLVLQPIWKTEGKRLHLHQDALDIFVWSNFAFTRLFFRDAGQARKRLSRGARSIVWLTKMLVDYAQTGRINHQQVIDSMSFNTMNDKAFAANGRVTYNFMRSEELTRPRIKRDEIRNIVLGGGEDFLSPERRLDAAILNTPGLFEKGM